MKKLLMTFCVFAVGISASVAQAQTSFRVEVTNGTNTDFFATPVWYGLHNGGFDFFDAGAPASPELETIAELGNAAPLSALFEADPSSPGDINGVIASSSGVPPIAPGETAVGSFTPINPANYRYFSYASMVVPTNDTFIGNDDAMAHEIFDASGNFLGTNGVFEILVTNIYDAGTEVNDAGVDGGAAFAAGRTGTDGADQGENVLLVDAANGDLDVFGGLVTPNGFTINDTTLGAGEAFATIRIIAVPEPSSVGFLALGLGGLFLRRRRS